MANQEYSAYLLKTVRGLISDKKVLINGQALVSAKSDFNMGRDDILEAIEKLNSRDFYKSAPHLHIKGVMVDYYKKDKLHKNFDIYTHFHVHELDGEDQLVIASFKEIK